MSERHNDGGPAFPHAAPYKDGGRIDTWGMSLRDYFAGQALIGLMADNPTLATYPTDAAPLAAVAYRYADAMLAERSKP